MISGLKHCNNPFLQPHVFKISGPKISEIFLDIGRGQQKQFTGSQQTDVK
jgi:hypothetical protein